MDDAVGIVLNKLDELGLADNTIVCFTSDNGGVSSGDAYSTSNTPLRGGKGRQWEGGSREPFYLKAPGVTKPGSRIDRAVDLVHFAPTVSDLAGVPFAGDLDGTSLRPLLEDPNAPWDRPAITTGDDASHAVRTDRWRYIRYRDGSEELYDHSSDPHEWLNLAGSADHARLLVELRRHLPKSRTWGSEPLRQPEE